MKFRKGTTLVELLIAVALIAVIGFFAFLNLFTARGQNDLQNTTRSIAALLREARSRSVSQTSSSAWGVHLENSTTSAPFYALFFSQNYGPTSTLGYYRLPPSVGYVTSSIAAGSSREITFSQLSGLASASTSVTIYLINTPGSSSTVTVASSGAVSY